MNKTKPVFLTAEWRDLAMLNYAVDPHLLGQYIPPGTTLDSFQGTTYISLVGFRFLRTKLFGSLRIPFHSSFDEVNLRFYVRRKHCDEERRGVVFIAEIVPRSAIAAIARLVYGENYIALPMKHFIQTEASRKSVEYQWRVNGNWCKISAQGVHPPKIPAEGSLEQFIAEHYWGYSLKRGGGLEYQVTHPPWQVWSNVDARFEGDVSSLYGPEIAKILQRTPDSALIADGSPVTVLAGRRLI